MSSEEISAEFPFEKQHVKVLDSSMAYVDTGASEKNSPVAVFLHGNPTSSYLWRNIIPHVSPLIRCIAPDLIGFGDSGKMPSRGYGVIEHIAYFNAFMDAVVPADEKVILVLHDWGSALGFNWAHHNEDRVSGLVFMEFIHGLATVEDFEEEWVTHLQKLRAEQSGLKLITEQNYFVEVILGQTGTVRSLTDTEMQHYRRPFMNPADRYPTWRFPNDIPVGGSSPEVLEIIRAFWIWLRSGQNHIPKLMFWAEPGMLVAPSRVKDIAEWMDNVKVVGLGPGRHYPQEDHPHVIGENLRSFVRDILKTG